MELPVYWQVIFYVDIALFTLLFTALIVTLVVRIISKPANIDPSGFEVHSIYISDSPNATINVVGGNVMSKFKAI